MLSVLAPFLTISVQANPLTEAEQETAQEVKLIFAFCWQDGWKFCWGGNLKLLVKVDSVTLLSCNRHNGSRARQGSVFLKLFWASQPTLIHCSFYVSMTLPCLLFPIICTTSLASLLSQMVFGKKKCILESKVQRIEGGAGLRGSLNFSQGHHLS